MCMKRDVRSSEILDEKFLPLVRLSTERERVEQAEPTRIHCPGKRPNESFWKQGETSYSTCWLH